MLGGISMNITIKNDFASVTCQTHGAELLSYRTADGKEYMWQKDAAYWAKTSPVLFPYVGPVPNPVVIDGVSYDMPRHGFVKDADFEVKDQGEDYIVLTTGTTDFTASVYPYDFEFTVTFRLNKETLDVIYGVTNKGTKEMMFLVGGHPGFFCPMEKGEQFTDYLLHFEDEDLPDLSLNYPMFDNDAIFYENLKRRTVKLIHKDTKKGIRFDFPDYLSVAFWTPIKKDAPFLCIEPWCAGTLEQVPNTDMAAKKYVQRLEAGAKKNYRFSVTPC